MYQNAVIYKIQHVSKPIVYIGGTVNYSSKVHQHKTALKSPKKDIDKLIAENGGWEAFSMSPLKKFPCKDKLDLLIEVENMKASLPKEEIKEIPKKPFLGIKKKKYTVADLVD